MQQEHDRQKEGWEDTVNKNKITVKQVTFVQFEGSWLFWVFQLILNQPIASHASTKKATDTEKVF